MKSFFKMEITSISHNINLPHLAPSEFGTFCHRYACSLHDSSISVVDDFEVPLTTLYDCVDTQENHIESHGNTDTDTDTDTHRQTV